MRTFPTLAAAALLAVGVAGAASAAPVSISTNFNVWTGTNPNPGDANDPTQQAGPSNPLTSQTFVGFFSYSGPINFNDQTQANDFMDVFIPGVGLPHTQMSSPPYTTSTLFEFTFVLQPGVTIASITHDDGISLFDITTNSGDLLGGSASGPTVAVTTPLPALTVGDNYELWYEADNGAPSVLIFNGPTTTPEPAAIALMGVGLLGLAMIRRRRG